MRRLLPLLFLSAFALSCSRSGGVLRMSFDNMPTTLDWNKYEDMASRNVILQVMSGLYSRLNRNAELVPEHLQSYETSPDGLLITITIKPGIFWSDGIELLAQHYYDSWIRTMNPVTRSARAQHFYAIRGAEDWNTSQKGSPDNIGLKVTGKYQLQIQLRQRHAFFQQQFADPYTFPIRSDLIERFGNRWTDSLHLATLGPYRIEEWVNRERITLVPYKRYSGSAPKLSRIQIFVIPEANSALTLFDVGKLDLLPTISPLDVPKWKDSTSFVSVPQVSTYYMGFSMRGPTHNKWVRQAIGHAIDNQEIIRATNTLHRPQKFFLPEAIKEANPKLGLQFNVSLARQLMAKAGFPNGRGFPTLRYAFNTHQLHRMVAENIQLQLKRHLNIDLTLIAVDWRSYLPLLRDQRPDLWRMGWTADNTAHDFMLIWMSRSEFNLPRWNNSRYDFLVSKALVTDSTETRRKYYTEAQELLLEKDTVIVPLFNSVLSCLVKPNVKDVVINPLGDIGLGRAWIGGS